MCQAQYHTPAWPSSDLYHASLPLGASLTPQQLHAALPSRAVPLAQLPAAPFFVPLLQHVPVLLPAENSLASYQQHQCGFLGQSRSSACRGCMLKLASDKFSVPTLWQHVVKSQNELKSLHTRLQCSHKEPSNYCRTTLWSALNIVVVVPRSPINISNCPNNFIQLVQ